MNRYSALPLSVLLLITAACALSPQTVELSPSLEPGAAGAGKSVSLEVRDARPGNVIGYRGGVYDTASITSAGDPAARIRSSLVDALAQRGFRLVAPGSGPDIALVVELTGLAYRVREEGVTRVIETEASVRGVATGKERVRTGDYRDRRTNEVVKPPTESGNAAYINAALSGALQQLVDDRELFR